jgi:hypothetical protein
MLPRQRLHPGLRPASLLRHVTSLEHRVIVRHASEGTISCYPCHCKRHPHECCNGQRVPSGSKCRARVEIKLCLGVRAICPWARRVRGVPAEAGQVSMGSLTGSRCTQNTLKLIMRVIYMVLLSQYMRKLCKVATARCSNLDGHGYCSSGCCPERGS